MPVTIREMRVPVALWLPSLLATTLMSLMGTRAMMPGLYYSSGALAGSASTG